MWISAIRPDWELVGESCNPLLLIGVGFESVIDFSAGTEYNTDPQVIHATIFELAMQRSVVTRRNHQCR